MPVTKRQVHIWFHLYEIFKIVEFTETEITWCLTEAEERERNRELANGYRVSDLQEGKVVEICFTTMWTLLLKRS